jgi:hypothetical protein
MKGVLERAIYVRDFWHDCVADRFTSTGNPDGSGDYAGKAWPSSRLDAMRTEVAKMICMFNGYIVPGVYEDQVICDGDTGYQPEKQLGGLAKWVEDAHATQGTHCFQLTFKGGKGYADKWGRPPEKDWRGYRFLKLDIVNGENRVVNINLNLRDQLAANTGAFNVTNSRKFACAPGKNSFVIPLVGLKGNDGKYTLDLSCLFSYYFTTEGDQDVTVYVDNMRLTPR